jgi:uridine kinase
MSLPPGEPAAGPWRVAPLATLVRMLEQAAGTPVDRPRVIAIDGRSASGKSTLASLLQQAVPASAVVHTDDVAWNHSFFDWAGLLAGGILEPLRRARPVHYRPPGWEAHRRPGAIDVSANLGMVVVEGVGAGRRELAHLLDAVVWVQSDFAEAERRGVARDIAQRVNGDAEQSVRFWQEWMAEELAFIERQRPWERACVIVAGTTVVAYERGQVVLASPPVLARSR